MCSVILGDWLTSESSQPHALEVGGLIFYWNYLGVKMGNFRIEATRASPMVLNIWISSLWELIAMRNSNEHKKVLVVYSDWWCWNKGLQEKAYSELSSNILMKQHKQKIANSLIKESGIWAWRNGADPMWHSCAFPRKVSWPHGFIVALGLFVWGFICFFQSSLFYKPTNVEGRWCQRHGN